MNPSTVTTNTDSAGEYEIEVFDKTSPKGLIICVHGRGVHRWDGERFFDAVAKHFDNYATYLVEQNQFDRDVCLLNPLPIAVARVQKLVDKALHDHPNTPVILMGHSLGCGIITKLNLDKVSKIIFVAPTAGNEREKLISRYGEGIRDGKMTKSVDGFDKYISKDYFDSVDGITWETEYQKLADNFSPIYVFESGNEEIVGEERMKLRTMPFSVYKVIPGAPHNYSGEPLNKLFTELDRVI